MKYLNKLLFLPLLLVGLFACEDSKYLDLAPEQDFSEADVYENYYTARAYLDNCYRALFDYQGTSVGGFGVSGQGSMQFEAMSDNAATTVQQLPLINGDWYSQEGLAEVGYSTSNMGVSEGRVWSNSSYCLRIANKLLVNIETIPSTAITEEERDCLYGQAYFFRAWYYFEWIRRWGGMPPVNKVYASDDDNDLPRQSYSKCSEDIISDLDQAIELLPERWDDENQGRAEKCSALALKGMVALYAASPLMQNSIDATIKRSDYSQDWAKRAAIYGAATLEYVDAYRPDKKMIGKGLAQEVQDSLLRDVFVHTDYMGREALWSKNHTIQNSGNGGTDREANLSVLYQNIRVSGRKGTWGNSITTPTQNLVDAFEMADGTKFNWNDAAQASKPYANRDPRLYNTIVFPGEQHSKVGVASKGGLATLNPIGAIHDLFYLETWKTDDGKYGLDISYDSWTKNIPTGYMCKKWWWYEGYGSLSANPGGYGEMKYNSEYIRTTQVWLDVAEAVNEIVGPSSRFDSYTGPTAIEAVNEVRNRVGMPSVDAGISQSDLRELIRNERRIELAFEYHRWFDIRRWMLFDDLFSETYPIKGIESTVLNTNGTQDQEQWDYSYEVVEVRTEPRGYGNKHYWYPLPPDHINHLYNCKQNPGW